MSKNHTHNSGLDPSLESHIIQLQDSNWWENNNTHTHTRKPLLKQNKTNKKRKVWNKIELQKNYGYISSNLLAYHKQVTRKPDKIYKRTVFKQRTTGYTET